MCDWIYECAAKESSEGKHTKKDPIDGKNETVFDFESDLALFPAEKWKNNNLNQTLNILITQTEIVSHDKDDVLLHLLLIFYLNL